MARRVEDFPLSQRHQSHIQYPGVRSAAMGRFWEGTLTAFGVRGGQKTSIDEKEDFNYSL